ncbi:MAG: hypothetical protein K2Q25_05725 [Mycobacteriaceae bacterium]|nr:hypothetical protein [Mycobacteriaceae bacterium]
MTDVLHPGQKKRPLSAIDVVEVNALRGRCWAPSKRWPSPVLSVSRPDPSPFQAIVVSEIFGIDAARHGFLRCS